MISLIFFLLFVSETAGTDFSLDFPCEAANIVEGVSPDDCIVHDKENCNFPSFAVTTDRLNAAGYHKTYKDRYDNVDDKIQSL